jgi:hypothetical protein
MALHGQFHQAVAADINARLRQPLRGDSGGQPSPDMRARWLASRSCERSERLAKAGEPGGYRTHKPQIEGQLTIGTSHFPAGP